MPIQIDESRRSILLVSLTGAVSDEEFEQYLGKLTDVVLARESDTVTIFDLTRAESASASRRQRQARWLAENDEAIGRHSLGSAFVVRSTVTRAALTAILWLQPMERPYVVVGTVADAEAWARARLRGATTAQAPALSRELTASERVARRDPSRARSSGSGRR